MPGTGLSLGSWRAQPAGAMPSHNVVAGGGLLVVNDTARARVVALDRETGAIVRFGPASRRAAVSREGSRGSTTAASSWARSNLRR